jgi:hypothetical protein
MSALWPEPARLRAEARSRRLGQLDGPLPSTCVDCEANEATLPLAANSKRGPSLAPLFDDEPKAKAE